MSYRFISLFVILTLPVYSQIFEFAGEKLFISRESDLFRQTSSPHQFEKLNFGPDNKNISLLYFVSESVGFAAKENELYRTTDGGSVWTKIFESGNTINASGFESDGATILILGGNLSVYRSFNGGVSFDTVSFQLPLQNYNYIKFAGMPHAGKIFLYAPNFNPFAQSFNYLSSADSCRSWQIIESLGEKGVSKFISAKHGFVTTMSRLWFSSNGGQNWNIILQDAGVLSGLAAFGDSLTGYQGVWSVNSLLRTTNGGASWDEVYRGNSGIDNLAAGKSNVAIRETGSEAIKYSSDKGATWTSVTLPSGIESAESENPVSFRLLNNYPNPFNGSTQITFTVPFEMEAVLKIYDLRGSIIQEKLPVRCQKGVNVINYNSGNLPSGVWFYRLEPVGTGLNPVTGKMVILK